MTNILAILQTLVTLLTAFQGSANTSNVQLQQAISSAMTAASAVISSVEAGINNGTITASTVAGTTTTTTTQPTTTTTGAGAASSANASWNAYTPGFNNLLAYGVRWDGTQNATTLNLAPGTAFASTLYYTDSSGQCHFFSHTTATPTDTIIPCNPVNPPGMLPAGTTAATLSANNTSFAWNVNTDTCAYVDPNTHVVYAIICGSPSGQPAADYSGELVAANVPVVHSCLNNSTCSANQTCTGVTATNQGTCQSTTGSGSASWNTYTPGFNNLLAYGVGWTRATTPATIGITPGTAFASTLYYTDSSGQCHFFSHTTATPTDTIIPCNPVNPPAMLPAGTTAATLSANLTSFPWNVNTDTCAYSDGGSNTVYAIICGSPSGSPTTDYSGELVAANVPIAHSCINNSTCSANQTCTGATATNQGTCQSATSNASWNAYTPGFNNLLAYGVGWTRATTPATIGITPGTAFASTLYYTDSSGQCHFFSHTTATPTDTIIPCNPVNPPAMLPAGTTAATLSANLTSFPWNVNTDTCAYSDGGSNTVYAIICGSPSGSPTTDYSGELVAANVPIAHSCINNSTCSANQTCTGATATNQGTCQSATSNASWNAYTPGFNNLLAYGVRWDGTQNATTLNLAPGTAFASTLYYTDSSGQCHFFSHTTATPTDTIIPCNPVNPPGMLPAGTTAATLSANNTSFAWNVNTDTCAYVDPNTHVVYAIICGSPSGQPAADYSGELVAANVPVVHSCLNNSTCSANQTCTGVTATNQGTCR